MFMAMYICQITCIDMYITTNKLQDIYLAFRIILIIKYEIFIVSSKAINAWELISTEIMYVIL